MGIRVLWVSNYCGANWIVRRLRWDKKTGRHLPSGFFFLVLSVDRLVRVRLGLCPEVGLEEVRLCRPSVVLVDYRPVLCPEEVRPFLGQVRLYLPCGAS